MDQKEFDNVKSELLMLCRKIKAAIRDEEIRLINELASLYGLSR